jgi:ABC-2 type transport system ATP-binding protein
MIQARRVSRWFGPVRALTDVSFDLAAGQVVGLLGPNGAGKTTTIRIITGFLPPSAGSVEVCGHDTVADSVAARRSIGYLPESVPLYPEMSVRGYLEFRAGLFGVGRRERRAAIGSCADRCGLTSVLDRRIGTLSKGFRQRVGLGAALLHDPPVVILDEPASGLDPAQIMSFRSLLRSLAERKLVLVSSHILPEIEKTCDRVLVVSRGELRADGAPNELIQRVLSDVPYVVEVPAIDAGRPRLQAALTGIEGVAVVGRHAASDARWDTWLVTPKAGAPDLREPIAAAAAYSGLIPREISRRGATLESVFLRIIESADSGAPLRSGGAAA